MRRTAYGADRIRHLRMLSSALSVALDFIFAMVAAMVFLFAVGEIS